MNPYVKRFSLFFVLAATVVFVIVVFIQYYVQGLIVQDQLKAFKCLIERSAHFVSTGYFQWTPMKEAIERNDTDFIASQFEEMMSLDPFIADVTVEDVPPNFEGLYIVESDGERLWARFKIFTDLMEEHAVDKTAKVVWDLDSILEAISADFRFDKKGKPTHFGLRYRYSFHRTWFIRGTLSAFAALALILVLHNFLVSNILKVHWETEGLERLVRIVGSVDHYTAQHSQRVSKIAELMGKKMGLRSRDVEVLRVAGTLHDIGKIAIPPHILNKPGRLDKEEYETMKRHPLVAAEILKGFPELSEVLPVVLYHHERQDGSGYPFGLKDGEIPLLARILAVADVFEALTSDRPYRKALSVEEALDLMRKLPLDQRIVSVLAEHIGELEKIRKASSEGWTT